MTQAQTPDEDLIESEPASPRSSELRRRLDILVPAAVGRNVLATVAAAVLVLGLVAGFVVGTLSGTVPTGALALQSGGAPEGGYIPIIPDDSALEGVVAVAFAAGLLTYQDLATAGELAMSGSYGLADPSGLDGLCGIISRPDFSPIPPQPGVEYTVFGSASYVLAGATLTQRIGPDLDVLAASTLRGTVELAQSCSDGGDVTVRTDGIQTSADDNVLVTGVSGEKGGLGYFGFSFFEQNQDKLNPVKVDGGSGCVEPSSETIQSGEYKPLARPLFMYPSEKALKKPEVKAFLEYITANYQEIAEVAKIVPMSEEQATEAKSAIGG